jgi:hypothetical protein
MLTILASFFSGAFAVVILVSIARGLRELRDWRRHGWRRTYRCPVCGRVRIVRRRTPRVQEAPP